MRVRVMARRTKEKWEKGIRIMRMGSEEEMVRCC